MSAIATGWGRCRQAAIVVGALALTVPLQPARAGGLFDFFGSFDERPASRPLPQPDESFGDAPELVVRPKPRHHRRLPGTGGSQRYSATDLKDVTIYNDKTLVRGDAVMTTSGLKVFNGERGAAHAGDDFVAVAGTGGLSKGVRSQLIAIDNASRPGLAR